MSSVSSVLHVSIQKTFFVSRTMDMSHQVLASASCFNQVASALFVKIVGILSHLLCKEMVEAS